MKRVITLLSVFGAILLFQEKGSAQNALDQLEYIAGQSVDATRASNAGEARAKASDGWDHGGPGNAVWKANRREAWNERRAERARIRQQRREARANRRRYHLRDYKPRW